MPVKVSCHCGQSFTAKDELIGQTLLCPKCSQPLTIQASSAAPAKKTSGGIDDLFEEAGLEEVRGPRCPHCGTAVQKDAVLCVSCGFNLQTGDRVQGAVIRSDEGAAVAEMMLASAEKEIAYSKSEEKKNQSQGTPAWMLFLILVIVLGFSATMYIWPREQAVLYTGYEVMGLGGLMILVGVVRIIIEGFFRSYVHGLLCLFIPPYMLFFVAMNWKKCGPLATRVAAGGLVILFGYGLTQASPWFRPEELNVQLPQGSLVAASLVAAAPLDFSLFHP